MEAKALFVGVILVAIFGSVLASNESIGTAYIYAPAVLISVNRGTLTTISLNVTAGNGKIAITGPSSVGTSTIQSAQTAVAYATSFLGINESKYNFIFTINDSNVSVSGPSAGLALTVLTISALSHKPLLHDFTLTGTIEPNGSVGLIGGVYDKASIAAEKGMKFIMVPYAVNGSFEDLLYYISQSDLGIPVVEAANASQALNYAFGYASPSYMGYTAYTQYNISGLPKVNATCNNCYLNAFYNLTAYTINETRSITSKLSPSFYSSKSSILASLDQDQAIANKGYYYEAADLAFLTYQQAFAMLNSHNISKSSAEAVVSNVSSYCSSLTPPPMTNSNYEYVIGGETRQGWANITLQQATTLINNAQTSDDYIEATYYAGEAYAWCNAANYMYNAASSIGGNYVTTSTSLESAAYSAISSDAQYGNNIYLQSAQQEFGAGDYGAALYDAAYAKIFYGTLLPTNSSALISGINANIANATQGIWPYEFANTARFIYYTAEHNASVSGLQQAYTISLLASGLEKANQQIYNSFIPAVASETVQPIALTTISSEIEEIYLILLVMAVLLGAILIALLIILLRGNGKRRR